MTEAASRLVHLREPHFMLLWCARAESVELKQTLIGHKGPISALVVTHDGNCAITASFDGLIKVWDIQRGQQMYTVSGHKGKVNSVAVTPDNRYAISASEDSTLKIWNIQTQETHILTGHDGSVNDVAVTPDGRYAISASNDCTLKLWDIQTHQEVRNFIHTKPVSIVKVTSDAPYAISASKDGILKIWNIQTGEEEHAIKTHKGDVDFMVISVDGNNIISASRWDKDCGGQDERYRVDCRYPIFCSNIGYFMKLVPKYGKMIWTENVAGENYPLSAHDEKVNAIALTPDGNCAISVSDDGLLIIWDLKELKVITSMKEETGVVSIVFTPDGRHAISGSDADSKYGYCKVIIWDEASRALATFALDRVQQHISILPDGVTILSGDTEGNIYCLRYVDPKITGSGTISSNRINSNANKNDSHTSARP
jgi:dipeptidyl aminopeptidase/acylaminoacyl peptidase